MNTPTIARYTNAAWLRRGIAIVGTLLIVAAIATVLMLRSPSGTSPAARTIPAAVDSSTPLDQHERHATALTDRSTPLDQHERHPERLVSRAENAALDQLAALKQAQAEARDTTYAPAPVQATGAVRFAAMKERQAEVRDGTVVPAPVEPSGRERFREFKQRQAELHEGGR
jgi:hypothetical protein